MMNVMEQMVASAKNVDATATERIGSPSLGDVVRQGDIYLICVDFTGRTETAERQLAPGTTRGSRHVLLGDVTVWKENPEQDKLHLKGPSFRCNSDVEVDHPDHGNKILPAGTTWATVYQRVGKEERMVKD